MGEEAEATKQKQALFFYAIVFRRIKGYSIATSVWSMAIYISYLFRILTVQGGQCQSDVVFFESLMER